jgi:hypothetical protein
MIKVGGLYKINKLTVLWKEPGKLTVMKSILNPEDMILILEIKDISWAELKNSKKEYRVLTADGNIGWILAGDDNISNTPAIKRSIKSVKKISK